MHTCLDSFKANDEHCAPYAQVPDKDGHFILPEWVWYLDDRHIAAYAIGAPINAMPYIVDIYAEPSLDNDDKLFEPMPHWFRAAMHADKAHWQVLYKEVYKIAPWGITADIKQHQDLIRVADSLASRIKFMQRDLEGARQSADLREYRLQAAQAHKYADHAQGLVSHGIHFTKQNIQAHHILCKNNDKGKGRAI